MHKLSISDLHILLVEPSDTQSKIIKTLLLAENVQTVDVVQNVDQAKASILVYGAVILVRSLFLPVLTGLDFLRFF